MRNDAKYTRAEELALKATTYEVMTTALRDFGWEHDTEEAAQPNVEIWKKRSPRAALLVFSDGAVYSDLLVRQAESVRTFAKAEGLSRLETAPTRLLVRSTISGYLVS